MAFKPTVSEAAAALEVLRCMAKVDAVRPVVEAYTREILARNQFVVAAGGKMSGVGKRVILRSSDVYLMGPRDLGVFDRECKAARDAAGLTVERDGMCPLLISESRLRDAEQMLLGEISKRPGFGGFGGLFPSLEHRKQAVERALSLLAPFVAERVAVVPLIRVRFIEFSHSEPSGRCG